MKYRQLGSTGARVSSIILGCGSFGGVGADPRLYGKGVDDAEAARIMDTAVDLGINCFDTSNSYGGGTSEAAVGAWLKKKGSAARDQLVLSTKVHHPVGDGPNDYGLSRRHIMQQIEVSLRRLNVDHVDMYLPHAVDMTTPLEETLEALNDLVVAGKVRYLGASGFPAWMMTKALWLSDKYHLHRFQWIQDSYSLMDRNLDAEMLPLCEDQGLAITAYSPLAAGILSGKYRKGLEPPAGSRVEMSPHIYGRMLGDEAYVDLDLLQRFAEKKGVSMPAVAVGWLLALPYTMLPIIGPRRPGHLDLVPEALDLELTDEDMTELGALFATSRGVPRRWHRPVGSR
ncbi:aldo/keto reductase [Amycolatopsis jejuensis]|uniref:aldo/keto reductase n=1 Tax=Amycolatopsis jejuensis TaxID=330084 RepID=UPI0006896BCA|nr:aldo/keto reductase [Amycolatopsis jejuensis]